MFTLDSCKNVTENKLISKWGWFPSIPQRVCLTIVQSQYATYLCKGNQHTFNPTWMCYFCTNCNLYAAMNAAYRPENSSGLTTYSSAWLLLPQAWWMKRESEREMRRSRKKHDVHSPHSQHECLMTSCSPLQTSHSSTHSACAASGQPLSFAQMTQNAH